MNLIEQLGGYENSKGLFSRYDHAITFKYYPNYVEDSNNFVDVFVPDLQQALLQYRREHNIFEVGDKVLMPIDISDEVLTITQGDLNQDYVDWFRHATPEEIQAGRRLEVCGVNK